nr:condensin-2 complex subunit G2-like isoform X1 [Osmia lignaria]
MLRQRVLLRDEVLFRILKSKSPTANRICGKLNHNVKNIVLLSEDELCELWQHVKSILFEAKKLYTRSSNNDRYTKEYSVMIKLIRSITAITLETITQRMFIPNLLLQNVMLLHSVIFPNIKNEQVKNEISCLLENWWKLDMIWKEKVITNALIYLIQNCKSSLLHVKRLYEIKSSIILLKSTKDVQELLKLVRENTVMSFEEGRMLLLHLFTLGEQYILGIHNNVKVVLQDIGHNYITRYADLYVTAWVNTSRKLKKFIVENCFQDIIFHCFHTHRDSRGRGKLGKNLLSFLTAIHHNKNQTVRLMIHSQCKPLLWKHLKAPGSYTRCNAIEILFITSSIHFTYAIQAKYRTYLEKYYEMITDLLNDSDYEVCNITMTGIFKMLEKYWNHIPNSYIHNWLNILLRYTKNSSNSEMRANVFIGLKNVLVHKRSHKIIKDFLRNFSYSIYDKDSAVLDALIKLLWHVQNQFEMPFWNIVPLTYILDRLETTQNIFLLRELIKLTWSCISLNSADYSHMTDEITHVGMTNLNAIRRFCLHSTSVINCNQSVKIIETILSIMKEEMQCLTLKKISEKDCNKKLKLNNEESNCKDVKYINDFEEDLGYKEMQIYVDVIAILLLNNVENIEKGNFNTEKTNILQVTANILPEFFKYFEGTSVNESIIFLFSVIPPKFFLNFNEIAEMLVQQLYDPNTCDDTVLTIIYGLMKWNKGDTILFALTNVFAKSLDINPQHNENPIDSAVFKIDEQGLELSLRILKHLLHVEHQSVLINKYHENLLGFWKNLDRLKIFIEKELSNDCNMNGVKSKDLIVTFFKEYVSMTSLLHKEDVFDASQHFSEILLWVKRILIPHISHIDVDTIENYSTCMDLIKITFDISNLLLKGCNSTPKLCCDIVLLYCRCLSTEIGVAFLNNAFNAIMIALDFSKIAYENQEPNLINIVVPNFVYVTMITLTKCKKDILIKYTNNLIVLRELTQKYFSIIKSIFNDQDMCLPYITIMLNVAISSISTEMTRLLQSTTTVEKSILTMTFPYLAKKILKIILDIKKYQKLSIQVLTGAITNYTRIDMLSALVVIRRMLKSSHKKVINKLKNITLASKAHNQNQSYYTSFDRSICDATNIVIDAILNR